MNKDKVVVIVGPTGIGKTDISLRLCEKFNGEVINCDASQMKKKLNIGTAKIDLSQTNITHHLIDIIEPDEYFSQADFQKVSRKLISEINERGKIPFIVGGTGLYVNSAIYNYEYDDYAHNKKIEEELKGLSNDELYEKLMELDPISCNKIHKNNRLRVIRAIECAIKGNKISEKNKKDEPVYDALIICLSCERKYLYDRINKRVLKMFDEGFVDEVIDLRKQGYNPFLFSDLGYRQITEYLDGLLSLDTVIEEISRKTRNYAKRQISWFNNQMNCIFVDVDKDREEAFEIISNLISDYLYK